MDATFVVVEGDLDRLQTYLDAQAREPTRGSPEGSSAVGEPPDVHPRPVRCPDEAARALDAAIRGEGLVVAVPSIDAFSGFLDDLSRLGSVRFIGRDDPIESIDPLDDEQRRLLSLLAEGSSIIEASARLHLSRRTASRRLATARQALGARSTAEAVAIARRRGLC
jgi:DNA-binding NarL/FixJ family response regulator